MDEDGGKRRFSQFIEVLMGSWLQMEHLEMTDFKLDVSRVQSRTVVPKTSCLAILPGVFA